MLYSYAQFRREDGTTAGITGPGAIIIRVSRFRRHSRRLTVNECRLACWKKSSLTLFSFSNWLVHSPPSSLLFDKCSSGADPLLHPPFWPLLQTEPFAVERRRGAKKLGLCTSPPPPACWLGWLGVRRRLFLSLSSALIDEAFPPSTFPPIYFSFLFLRARALFSNASPSSPPLVPMGRFFYCAIKISRLFVSAGAIFFAILEGNNFGLLQQCPRGKRCQLDISPSFSALCSGWLGSAEVERVRPSPILSPPLLPPRLYLR